MSEQTPAEAGIAAVAGEPVVNGFALLDTLAALPVSTWRYNWEPEHVRHLGPMAQDWRAAFGLGDSETTIPAVDANGVAVVAIAALYRVVKDLQQEIEHLRAQTPTLWHLPDTRPGP